MLRSAGHSDIGKKMQNPGCGSSSTNVGTKREIGELLKIWENFVQIRDFFFCFYINNFI